VDIGSLLVADSQSAKLVEPGKATLDYPPPSAQPAAMLGVTHREQRHDAALTQTLPDCLRIITAVAQDAIRTVTWTPARSLQRYYGIDERERLLRVVTVGPGELECERNTLTVADQMTLAAELGPIGRIGTRLLPPKTDRMELLSTTARDQSILSERASQSRSTKWISCKIPASCQSRKRRQQVMPEPHPSSCGSISHGMPLRNTKRMPTRHARSAKRGLPP